MLEQDVNKYITWLGFKVTSIKLLPTEILVGANIKYRNRIYKVLELKNNCIRVSSSLWLEINSVERYDASC